MCSWTGQNGWSTSTSPRNPQVFFPQRPGFLHRTCCQWARSLRNVSLLPGVWTSQIQNAIFGETLLFGEVPSRQVSNDRCGNHRVARDVAEMCIEIDPSTGVLEQGRRTAHLSCTRTGWVDLSCARFLDILTHTHTAIADDVNSKCLEFQNFEQTSHGIRLCGLHDCTLGVGQNLISFHSFSCCPSCAKWFTTQHRHQVRYSHLYVILSKSKVKRIHVGVSQNGRTAKPSKIRPLESLDHFSYWNLWFWESPFWEFPQVLFRDM